MFCVNEDYRIANNYNTHDLMYYQIEQRGECFATGCTGCTLWVVKTEAKVTVFHFVPFHGIMLFIVYYAVILLNEGNLTYWYVLRKAG